MNEKKPAPDATVSATPQQVQQACAQVADRFVERDLAWAESHPDERVACEHRAERGRAIAGAIRALIPPARVSARDAVIIECMNKIDSMRISEAGLFDAKHSGQRGQDRSDALFDAHEAIRSLASGARGMSKGLSEVHGLSLDEFLKRLTRPLYTAAHVEQLYADRFLAASVIMQLARQAALASPVKGE